MIRVNRKLLDCISRIRRTGSMEYAAEQKLRPKEQIIQQGRSVSSVYIIKSGIAKCYMTEDNGKEFIQDFFGEGELFGEVEVINNTTSFCSIEAITDLVVYKIQQDEFRKLLAEERLFNQIVLQAMASKIHYKALRHSYHQSHAIADNFLRLKNQFPELTEKISKQDLASYLGVTLRSLNRTLDDLNRRNLQTEI